jgi:hypothetical protein
MDRMRKLIAGYIVSVQTSAHVQSLLRWMWLILLSGEKK